MSARRMRAAAGSGWPPFAALAGLGAGLVHAAVAASAPLPLALVLIVFAIGEVGWALATLAAGRIVLPTVALAAAAGSSLAWLGIAFVLIAATDADPALTLPLMPLAAATLFTLAVAFGCARTRRGSADRVPRGRSRRQAALFIAGAALVAAIATPALAATEAGRSASPHGGHTIPRIAPDPHGH